MLKRMASKFHLHGHNKDLVHSPIDTSSVSSANSSVLTPGYDHRGSFSTQRTSFSEWSKRGDSLDYMDNTGQAKRNKGQYRLSDFIIQRTLGTGSFGRVHLGQSLSITIRETLYAHLLLNVVRSKHNLRFYAIKVLNKERVFRMKQVEHTNNEQQMLESVQHPFIINLWGTFQDTANLYMVMDFVPGGELFTLIRRSNVGRANLNIQEAPDVDSRDFRTPLRNSTPRRLP
jgi:protein kinase A